MNVLLVIAGVLATGVLIGHSTLGRRDYFLPMLSAEFDPYAKRIMSFVWHMSTLSLCLMALALLALGFGHLPEGGPILGWFVFAHFLGWGVIHLLLGLTSGLPRAVARMFQWVLFFVVAALTGLGLSAH
jgi:hypothetical protein